MFLGLTFILLLSISVLHANFLGVTRKVERTMIWSYAESSDKTNQGKQIVIRFADDLDFDLGRNPSEIRSYLESLNSKRVIVTYDVTYDYGQIRSYSLVSIGEESKWREYLAGPEKGRGKRRAKPAWNWE